MRLATIGALALFVMFGCKTTAPVNPTVPVNAGLGLSIDWPGLAKIGGWQPTNWVEDILTKKPSGMSFVRFSPSNQVLGMITIILMPAQDGDPCKSATSVAENVEREGGTLTRFDKCVAGPSQITSLEYATKTKDGQPIKSKLSVNRLEESRPVNIIVSGIWLEDEHERLSKEMDRIISLVDVR